MVKIRILQNVGVGVAGAAAFVGAGTVGCTAPVEDAGTSQSSADTATTPAGKGVVSLRSFEHFYQSTSGGDEFIRSGERLKATLDFRDAVYFLSQRDGTAEQRIGNDSSKVKALLKVTYQNLDGSQLSQVTLPVTWAGAQGAVVGTSDAFVIPKGAPHMTLAYVLTEAVAGTIEVGNGMVGHATFPIFGAFSPNKLVLFDNDANGQPRARIVEGGTLTPGKDVTISYTDWRADREVNRSGLDTTIGDGRSYSRFGTFVVPIQGTLTYEVSFAYSTDNGQTWQDGGALQKHDNPEVLGLPGPYRSAYEKTIRLPANATGLKVAFHLRAVLIADPHYQYVDHWKNGYQLGGHYVLQDMWDNNGGPDYAVATTP